MFNGDLDLDEWGRGLEYEKSRDDRRDRETVGLSAFAGMFRTRLGWRGCEAYGF
jgi:hypothetical protein